MNGARAVYSVIQFRPDLARAEGVNVGVVVVAPANGAVEVRMSENNERVKRAFGARHLDEARLDAGKRSMERRLRSIEPTAEALDRFTRSQGNNLVLLPARAVVAGEDARSTAQTLFTALVGVRARTQRDRAPKGPDLESFFKPLLAQNIPLRWDVVVPLPTLGKNLKAALSYTNGAINYIKSEGFGRREHNAVEQAKSLAGDGLVLSKHPDQHTGLDQHLIVAAKLKDPAIEARIRPVFEDFGVRLVLESEMLAFVAEVQQHAHD